MQVGGPDRKFDFFFIRDFFQHIVVLLSEDRVNFSKKNLLGLTIKLSWMEK